MKNKSYIGLGIIILVFGYWFLPKIFNRINTNQTIDSNRTMSIDQSSKLSFIKLNGCLITITTGDVFNVFWQIMPNLHTYILQILQYLNLTYCYATYFCDNCSFSFS